MNCTTLLSTGVAIAAVLAGAIVGSVLADEPVSAAFAVLDTNRDGELELAEFLQGAGNNRGFIRRRQFYLLDGDENQHLSEAEFLLPTQGKSLTALNAFRFYDLDANELLSQEEYLSAAGIAEAGAPLARRNYRVVDFDGNGELSFAEFCAFPGILPPQQRGTIPDPVLDLESKALKRWQTLKTAADGNQDGQLSETEWTALQFPEELSPFQAIAFIVWDADGSGAVTDAEAERLFAISYGIRHPDGTLLRLPSGVRYYDSFLRPLDTNGDLVLSSEELANGYWGGKEKGAALFQELDGDKDDKLTPAEIMATRPLTVDVLSAYLRVDTDLDGLASPAELQAYPSSGATPLGIAQTMAAFDEDRDGFLSLREYQLAPLGYGYVTLRVHGKIDQDHDGALSWQEFYSESSLPALPGLAWELFRRYDLDHNGKLTLDELEFRIDPNKVSLETLFVAKDRNRDGQLTLEELFLDRRPSESDSAALVRYAERERYWKNWLAVADADQSLGVSLTEYQVGRSQFPEQHYSRFVTWDKNSDGALTIEEYLAGALPKDEPLARRNYRVVDFDGNGDLSFAEFCAFPGILPPQQRGTIPDPVLDLYAKALSRWLPLKAAADGNQDGQLSETEWTALQFPEELSPFQAIAFIVWDADGNGAVTDAEAVHLFAISYGIRHPDGTLLRLPSGIRYYDSFLRPLDTNGDLVLSSEELANGYWGGKEKGAALFQELDADKDGKLTPAEIMATRPLTVDVLGGLLYLDTDLDGRLSPAELLAHKSTGATPLGVAQTMAVFDEDRDGFLSLSEFQLAPLGYGYVTLRIHGKTDQDHDGALSWKEFYSESSPPVLPGLAWELFRRYDLDHNRVLTLDELEFRIDPNKVPLDTLFVARDLNKNQRIEKDEFVVAMGTTPVSLRNFRLVDFDADNALTLDEFRSLPSVPAEQRGQIPDPMVDLAGRALASWQEATKTGSTAGDRGVTSRNWPGALLKERLGPLGELPFSAWDANRDGYVDLHEAEVFLAVAYGLQRPDGTPLRRSNGLVLYGSSLRRFDKNRDGLIVPDEFIPQYWEGPQKAAQLFDQLDTDNNHQLSYAEFWNTRNTSIDTYSAFFDLDKDFDGLVSPAELLRNKSSGATEKRIEQILAAFDENHDGQLSLGEYRLLPIGMGYITYDVWGRQDTDNNGYLSWTEFFTDSEPALLGLAWELFHRLDRDQDGQLGFDEFEYRVNPAKVPVEIEFRLADLNHDQRLQLSEIFKDPKPTSGNGMELERYRVRMARAEDKFLHDDRDHNGWLTLEEFKQAREATLAAAERHRRATGRLSKVETSDWFLPTFLVIDAVVLAGTGWYVLRRRSS